MWDTAVGPPLYAKLNKNIQNLLPFGLFLVLVFLRIFLLFRNFEGESSVSASSCELLDGTVSTPSGMAFKVARSFLRAADLKVNTH